jgi:hypothetical protein
MVRLVRWLFRYRNGQVRRVANQERSCRRLYGNQNERQGVIPDERFPGHTVFNPNLPDEDFQEAVQNAKAEFESWLKNETDHLAKMLICVAPRIVHEERDRDWRSLHGCGIEK